LIYVLDSSTISQDIDQDEASLTSESHPGAQVDMGQRESGKPESRVEPPRWIIWDLTAKFGRIFIIRGQDGRIGEVHRTYRIAY